MKVLSPRAMRRVGAIVALGAASAALSGCLVIRDLNTAQLTQVGNVEIDMTLCASDTTGPTTCPDVGNTGEAAAATGQVLVGYRIPTNVTEPSSISSVDGIVQLTPSPTYAAELQRLAPAAAGFKWVGYISGSQTFNPAGGIADFRIRPQFTLQRAADGSPFTGPFLYRPVVGIRLVNGTTLLPGRPVACGDTLVSGNDGHVCVDSPSVANAATNLSITTRDLGILAAPATAAAAGTTAQLAFPARYRGTSAAAVNFSLTGATTVPGALATPTSPTLVPGTNSDNTIVVSVPIPAGTAPGTYTATLTATLLGNTRSATGQITVPAAPVVTPPPPPPPPTVVVTAAKLKLSFIGLSKTVLKSRIGGKGVSFKLAPNRDASVTVQITQGGKTVLTKKLTVRKPSSIVLLKSAKVKKGKATVIVSGAGIKLTRIVTVK